MTKLYKRIGAVFIPAPITIEEVEKLQIENAELKKWINENRSCENCAYYDVNSDNCKSAETCEELSQWTRKK